MSESAQPLEIIDAQLAPVVAGLDIQTAANLRQSYAGHFKALKPWLEQANALTPITDASQVREMKLAGEVRKALKEIRVDADKTRKKLKAEVILYGKAIDGLFNVLNLAISPVEERLRAEEDFVKQQEQKRRDEIRKVREGKLLELKIDPSFYNLADMPDATFDSLLETHRQAFEASKAAAAKADAERIERMEVEAKRLQDQAAENERLKQEAAAREKQHADNQAKLKAQAEQREKELLEADRLAREQEIRAQELQSNLEAQERKLKQERDAREKEALEQQRKAAEQAKRDSDRAAYIEQEKLNREKLEAEKRALQIENDKLRVANEAKAKNAPPKLAPSAGSAELPDAVMLSGIAAGLRSIVIPSMGTVIGSEISANVRGGLTQLADYIDEEIKKIPAKAG